MSYRKPIRITEAGVLRAQFCDAAGVPIQASGVEVSLYAPDTAPPLDLPTVSGLTPTYLGEGTYQLDFTAIPPGGSWIDYWQGYVLGTLTTASLSFSVLDEGVIVDYPSLGPCQNNLIEITLSSGIKGLDGSNLSEDYEFFFTTEYSPMYSSVGKVRLELGRVLSSIPDFTISLALLEASIEADALSFSSTVGNLNMFRHARREYVTCLAANMLANNVLLGGGLLKSKRLADFAVEYDTAVVSELLDNLTGKCKRWQGQLEAGGALRVSRRPQGVVKGELDPNRPKVGRLWESVGPADKPFGTSKRLPKNKNRWVKTNKSSRKNGDGWNDDW